MIEKIFITSFLVYAIWYTLQDGEIFSFIGGYFYRVLPPALHNPFFECVICMAPWYGSIIYWVVWHNSIIECFTVILSSMGLNYIISKLIDH
jgi:hypothetical protein